MSNMKRLQEKYGEEFEKAGVPVSGSRTMNKCIQHFLKKRKNRVTSIFQTIDFVLNIEGAEEMKSAGVMIFGENWLKLQLEEIEDYMKFRSLEKVPSYSISEEDIENLDSLRIALEDLIISLKIGGTEEENFNNALARFYMYLATLTK